MTVKYENIKNFRDNLKEFSEKYSKINQLNLDEQAKPIYKKIADIIEESYKNSDNIDILSKGLISCNLVNDGNQIYMDVAPGVINPVACGKAEIEYQEKTSQYIHLLEQISQLEGELKDLGDIPN